MASSWSTVRHWSRSRPADHVPGFLVAHLNDWLWLVYVVLSAEVELGQLFYLAENALLPSLVPPERLVMADTLNTLNDDLARLVGPSIGVTTRR